MIEFGLLQRTGTRILCALILLSGLSILAIRPAAADASKPCTPASVPIITIPPTAVLATVPVGSPLGSPVTVNASFDCSNAAKKSGNPAPDATIQVAQLAPRDTAAAPNGGIMFKTTIPGIDVELTATPNQADAGPNGPGGVSGWELGTVCPATSLRPSNCTTTATTLSATFTAQLVKVGAVSAGTTSSVPLAQFADYSYGHTISSNYFATLTLAAFTVTTPACSVAVDPTVVTLPTVSTSAFSGTGSTAGQTAFAIKLTCASPPHTTPSLSITLNTSNPQAGTTGVIAPTAGAGMATRIGVQVVKANGSTPVTFGTAIAEGPTPNGAMSLPFFARYYQTSANPTAGKVTATATYTLTYP